MVSSIATTLSHFLGQLRAQSEQSLLELFSQDSSRGDTFSLKLPLPGGQYLYLDYSKNNVTKESLSLLIEMANTANLRGKMNEFISGAHINATEDRAVLHMALRDVDDHFKTGHHASVQAELTKMISISEAIRSGSWVGQSGLPIKHVVNIGIGGSDLGPCMVTRALSHLAAKDLTVEFVSNVDGCHLEGVLRDCLPDQTLFIVVSKTFTTRETILNATSAKHWLQSHGITDFGKHFVAVSSNIAAVKEFGIEKVVSFWDWVGGRYSLWSAVGLSIMIAIGPTHFQDLLLGAHMMDRHFFESPFDANMPVILALIGIWNRNVCERPTFAVIPYEQALSRLPAYLQQLDMESNGKSVKLDGKKVDYSTGPIVWGEPGTNGQHAFFQLIHQGTDIIPVDFLVGARSISQSSWGEEHHIALYANCVAQSEALMVGRKHNDPHKMFEGNRPSNTVVYSQLSSVTLGALIALYEHKTFVQGAIWGINSFDQMGVELGKVLATTIEKELASSSPGHHDSSTRRLMELFDNLPNLP